MSTDELRRFTLAGVDAGNVVLFVDGRSGGYGSYTVGVETIWQRTTVLDHMVWLPKLDLASAVTLGAQPLTTDVIVRNPKIPGLELHIPAGARVTDHEGKPVREVSLTPVPMDRPPFPLPAGVIVPLYFTIQPGGATVEPYGAKLIYPNSYGEKPGTRLTFWQYRPKQARWVAYGEGTVRPDGKQVVPDPGVSSPGFSGAMVSAPSSGAPLTGPPAGADATAGDPVDLATGLFVYEKTDLVVPDAVPIQIDCRYRPQDTRSRAFGMGSSHDYEWSVFADQDISAVSLLTSTGSQVRFTRTSPGTGLDGAVLEHKSSPSAFYGATMRRTGSAWQLRSLNGTTWILARQGPLQSATDRNGNAVTVIRQNSDTAGVGYGNILRLVTQHGRWVSFNYDDANRVTALRDSAGRKLSYTYDAAGRLATATDPLGGVTRYAYDTDHRMTSVTDPSLSAWGDAPTGA